MKTERVSSGSRCSSTLPPIIERITQCGPATQARVSTPLARKMMKRESIQRYDLKVLLVDDDDADIFLTRRSAEAQHWEVVSARNVNKALRQIVTQLFDVLITDLHMPDIGDGFAVVTAVRHSQPEALTLVASGNPEVQRSLTLFFCRQTKFR